MNYADINYFDIINGDGIGICIWVSGCTFRCPNCFNAKLQCPNYGKPFTDKTIKEIGNAFRDKPYLTRLTLCGGNPLSYDNPYELLKLVTHVKAINPNIKIWCYCGETWEEALDNNEKFNLVKECDVLLTGRFIEELKDPNLKWVGSSNQQVIDVQKSLSSKGVVLYENN